MVNYPGYMGKGMVNVKKIIFLAIFFILSSTAYGANVYKWTDQDGVVNFADNIGNVPPPYRNKVEVREFPSRSAVHGQGITSGTLSPEQRVKVDIYGRNIVGSVEWEKKGGKAEPTVDLFGQDASYWRDKVRPWEERFREATVNYNGAKDQFVRKAEKLSEMRFGSPTQYKMKIAELDVAKHEMLKYQGQISEAKEALEKISKEANEAGANPQWLK
jgi:hypothetical protein